MNNKIGNNFKKISMFCNFLARTLFLQAQPHCRPRRDIKLEKYRVPIVDFRLKK